MYLTKNAVKSIDLEYIFTALWYVDGVWKS